MIKKRPQRSPQEPPKVIDPAALAASLEAKESALPKRESPAERKARLKAERDERARVTIDAARPTILRMRTANYGARAIIALIVEAGGEKLTVDEIKSVVDTTPELKQADPAPEPVEIEASGSARTPTMETAQVEQAEVGEDAAAGFSDAPGDPPGAEEKPRKNQGGQPRKSRDKFVTGSWTK